MIKTIISDAESLEIYRKSLERRVAAKYATELATSTANQRCELQETIKREVEAEFSLYLKKRKKRFILF
jgi:hypothetical protein